VTVQESWVTVGVGAEVVALVAETEPTLLVAPAARVGALPVPIPSGSLRRHALPTAEQVVAAVRRVLGRGAT
jgi:pyruvate/2-oxoglutarate/acetoin dehydrogenase E1 component